MNATEQTPEQFRWEHDSLGEIEVPKEALYGAQAEESLTQAGFAVCGVFGGTDFSALTAESEKAFFVLKRI